MRQPDKVLNWDGKCYHTFDWEMKHRHGGKVIKLCIDGGFSCPNREKGLGCIFCTERGSGEFTGDLENNSQSITQQTEYQRQLLGTKWQSDKFIAYFQNYTNTYAHVGVLKAKYDEALACGAMGLAIATRPDCLEDDVLELISSYNCEKWVELGLQSTNCGNEINRGYDNSVFELAAKRLVQRGIPFVTHIIFGLPWDTGEDMLNTVRFAVKCGTWGIKIHMLYVDATAPLAKYYERTKFPIMTLEEYADIVTEALAIIPPKVVIHRLTGDGKKENLIAPLWSCDKRRVLNTIDKMMRSKNYTQGIKSANTGW